MKRQARYVALAALAFGLAVSLAACGSETTATTAQITFRSDPPAEIWIAGEAKGKTPTDVELSVGSYDVTFKAAGFQDVSDKISVEGGKDLTVNAELCAAAEDEVTLVQLAKVLGIEHAPYEEGKVHRGARNHSVTLLWPQRDVRREGLTSYRVDVSEEYEGDGFIEFRKGRTVLHRESFEPEEFATVRSMPESVKEAVKSGSSVTWGVYFENRRKKDITVKFKVVKKAKVDRQLAKLGKRSFFQRQPPLIQDLMRVDVLRNNRLYSEALVGSLGILQSYPQSLQPYRGIVEAAQRLGLKDTQLFAEAMQHVAGRGGRGRTAGGAIGKVADRTTPVAPVFSAPRQPDSGDADTPQPGGAVDVRPTEDAPADAQPDSPATPHDPRQPNPAHVGFERELADLRAQLTELEAREANAHAAEERLAHANSAFEAATQAANEAEQQAESARAERAEMENDATTTPEQLADQDALIRQREAAAGQATDEAAAAREHREVVTDEVRRILGQDGSDAEVRGEADALRQRIEDLERRQEATPTPNQHPDPSKPPTDDPAQRLQEHQDVLANAERNREQTMADADGAATAWQNAQAAMETAEANLQTAQAGGDATLIEAADKKVAEAAQLQEEARLANEAAQEAAAAAERDFVEATDSLSNFQDAQPPKEPGAPISPAPGTK